MVTLLITLLLEPLFNIFPVFKASTQAYLT